MSGFLLAEDAVSARKQQLDDWINEQKRSAEQAAQQTQQAAQQRASEAASAAAARAQEFQTWVSQQQQAQVQPAPAPPQPAAPAVPVPPAAGPPAPDVQERARQFQDWVMQQQTQQQQQAPQQQLPPDLAPPPQQPVSPAANATDATPVDRTSGRVFPVQGYQGQVDLHWGDVKGGADLFAPRGTPVVAMQGGRVVDAGTNSVGGNAVTVQGDDGNYYYYAHLDDAPAVQTGQRIVTGMRLGGVGDSGNAQGRGTHLHIGIGPDIRSGADKYGGTGGDFDATTLLRSALEPNGGGQQTAGMPTSSQTTAGMSGGGARAGQVGDQGSQILSGAADIASWLGADGQKALQSILVTEGGLAGARGDSGKSAGPLQFFEGGQLANFARQAQMTLEQAKAYVEAHPLEAIKWAIGAPAAPGYLGAAIVDGLTKNLTGADLATHAQRIGQVSDSPERAGQNYRTLFGQGQDLIRAGIGGFESALETGRQGLSRATDLIGQGQQLVDRTARGAQDAWSQFDQMQARTRDEGDRWLTEQRTRLDTERQQRQQQGQEFTQSIEDRMRQFRENAEPANRPPLEGFTAPGGPLERFGSLLTTEPPGYTSQFAGQQTTPEERQQQLAQTTDIRTGGLAPDVHAALLTGRADEQVGVDNAERIIQKAKDLGWEPEPRQERVAMGVLSTLTPLNILSLFVTGPEMLTMRGLAEGATFLGLSGAGSVAAGELFPDQPLAPLIGGLATPILGPAAFRGLRAGVRTPVVQEALRVRQPAQAEAGFAMGMPRRPEVPPAPVGTVTRGSVADRVEQAAVDHFGTTTDPRTGNWILRDGRILDAARDPERPLVSGRDHEAIASALESAGVRAGQDPVDTAIKRGMARYGVVNNELWVDLGQASLTRQQAAALRDIARDPSITRMVLDHPRGAETFAPGEQGAFNRALQGAVRDITRQGGQADPRMAMLLGRGALGGYAGYQSTPEEARGSGIKVGDVELPSVEAVGRTLGGAGLAIGAPGVAKAVITRPQIDQTILESLRRGGVTAGPPAPSGRVVGRNVGTVMDMTKQGILLDPVGRIMDMVSNTIELVRQPAALAMTGRGPEAAAGMAAVTRAIPEAVQNARLALEGMQVPTLGQGAQWTGRSGAVFRVMGAADMFTRTLGEYQGMATKAFQMLEDANIKPGTAQADQYLAQHADELYREGARSGSTSVFGQSKQAGQQSSQLDKMMAGFSTFKENMLNSSSLRDKAIGTLLDYEVPFSGTPSRVWQMAIQRVPGITQVSGVARIAKALEKGDPFAAQKAFGELALESMIQAQIAQGIREGHITGPDDPEHPSSVQIAGQWIPIRAFGVYGIPMGVMAAFAESWEKTGRQPDPETTDRFAAALNASMKPIAEGVPGFSMVKALASMGSGTGFTRAVTDIGSDVIDRFNPSILARAENMVDPYVRDIARRGPEQLWEPTFARNPVLARLLPPKLDPTTGEPRERGISILGAATKPSSELTAELARLKRMGYTLSPPDDKPSSVSINGISVPVKDGSPEQRAMVHARGQFLAEVGQQMKTPGYQRMTDDQKATMWSRMIDRSARTQARAWRENVPLERGARILSAGKRVVGRMQDIDDTERINREVALTNQLRRQRMRAEVA